MRLDKWWSSGSPQCDPWITFSLFCNTGVFVAYELKSIIAVFFSQPFQKSPLPPSNALLSRADISMTFLHRRWCRLLWEVLVRQWFLSMHCSHAAHMTPHSTPSFFTSPQLLCHQHPFLFCARPNMYDHWIAFNCIKFPKFLQSWSFFKFMTSWWMLDFIDLLHFYRSQPLMGRRHLRVNQQGRLVVESFCRRCRFECHGAQWCGPAGLSRISRLQAWCCAFRRSSVAGGGICAW